MFEIIIHQSEAAIEKPPFELSRLPSIWFDFIIYSTERHFHKFRPFSTRFINNNIIIQNF